LAVGRVVKKYGKAVAELMSSLGFVETIRATCSGSRNAEVKHVGQEILATIAALE